MFDFIDFQMTVRISWRYMKAVTSGNTIWSRRMNRLHMQRILIYGQFIPIVYASRMQTPCPVSIHLSRNIFFMGTGSYSVSRYIDNSKIDFLS
jgi:hypothetical protein